MINESPNTIAITQSGLNAAQAQQVLDYVAERLAPLDFDTAERLLDEFVDRMRQLDDIMAVKRAIAADDASALQSLGGIGSARDLVAIVERIISDS